MNNESETPNNKRLIHLYSQMAAWCFLSIILSGLLCWLVLPSINIALAIPLISAVIIAGIGGTFSAKKEQEKAIPKGFRPIPISILWAIVFTGLGYLLITNIQGDLNTRVFFVFLYGFTALLSLGISGFLYGIVFYLAYKRKMSMGVQI